MNSGITTLEKLEELVNKAKGKGFTKTSAVFINVKGDLAITFNDMTIEGYKGYFLSFETGEIRYSE